MSDAVCHALCRDLLLLLGPRCWLLPASRLLLSGLALVSGLLLLLFVLLLVALGPLLLYVLV